MARKLTKIQLECKYNVSIQWGTKSHSQEANSWIIRSGKKVIGDGPYMSDIQSLLEKRFPDK